MSCSWGKRIGEPTINSALLAEGQTAICGFLGDITVAWLIALKSLAEIN